MAVQEVMMYRLPDGRSFPTRTEAEYEEARDVFIKVLKEGGYKEPEEYRPIVDLLFIYAYELRPAMEAFQKQLMMSEGVEEE